MGLAVALDLGRRGRPAGLSLRHAAGEEPETSRLYQRPAILRREIPLDGCNALPNIDIRWGHRVEGVTPLSNGVDLAVATNGGSYALRAGWAVA